MIYNLVWTPNGVVYSLVTSEQQHRTPCLQTTSGKCIDQNAILNGTAYPNSVLRQISGLFRKDGGMALGSNVGDIEPRNVLRRRFQVAVARRRAVFCGGQVRPQRDEADAAAGGVLAAAEELGRVYRVGRTCVDARVHVCREQAHEGVAGGVAIAVDCEVCIAEDCRCQYQEVKSYSGPLADRHSSGLSRS